MIFLLPLSARRIALLTTICGLVAAPAGAAIEADDLWVTQFTSSGVTVNSAVYSVATSADRVCASGSFWYAGEARSLHVACFRSDRWISVGGGISGTVYSVALGSGETLFAGGTFNNAAGVTAANVARWNGTAWAAMGAGTNGAVAVLTTHGSSVYAGGSFTTAGGVPAAGIAMWNGSTWSGLGTGLVDGGFSGSAADIAVATDGTVYAVGKFNQAGGVAAANVARWDGSAWSALGSGLSGRGRAAAFWNGDLYVAGDFTAAGGVAAAGLARWDGTQWSAVPGSPGGIRDLAATSSRLYAGGADGVAGGIEFHGIAGWDGTQWSDVGGGIESGSYGYSDYLTVVATTATDLILGGTFHVVGGVGANSIARFDGTEWNALATADRGHGITGHDLGGGHSSAYVFDIEPTAGGAYVSGEIGVTGRVAANGLAYWDGSGWNAVGGLVQGEALTLAADAGLLYVAGEFDTAGHGPQQGISLWNVDEHRRRRKRLRRLGAAGDRRPALRERLLYADRRNRGVQHRPVGRIAVARAGVRSRRLRHQHDDVPGAASRRRHVHARQQRARCAVERHELDRPRRGHQPQRHPAGGDADLSHSGRQRRGTLGRLDVDDDSSTGHLRRHAHRRPGHVG